MAKMIKRILIRLIVALIGVLLIGTLWRVVSTVL